VTHDREPVLVLGAGISGLGAALLLGRAGHPVLVLDRDPAPDVANGDDAFTGWPRRSVPQWRLAHVFSSRARNLLKERAPDVLARLLDDGVEEVNFIDYWLDPADRLESDDQFTVVDARRPAFELALRRAVEAQKGVEIRPATNVTGLLWDEPDGRVRGLVTEDGETITAGLVLDCGGRRSRVSAWLRDAGIIVPTEVQDCGLTYFTRYFRQRPEVKTSQRPVGNLGYLLFATMAGDHNTYAITLAAPPWDAELKELRHNEPWEAMCRSIPGLRPWVEPETGTPLTEVQVMAGHQSVRRHYEAEDGPLVEGLVSVGDALCTSNPFFSWGASMALTHAFTVADAIVADPATAAETFYRAVADETNAVYRNSAASDRIRTFQWKGLPIPPEDTEAAEQQDLLQRGILPSVATDPDLLRAVLRRAGLLEHPDAIFADEAVMTRARAARQRLSGAEAPVVGPSREEASAILAGALGTLGEAVS
jgi:2-polyprenyl-6-methoxyphenol hydroxylase-like FAD-dependent oxidoreductase